MEPFSFLITLESDIPVFTEKLSPGKLTLKIFSLETYVHIQKYNSNLEYEYSE